MKYILISVLLALISAGLNPGARAQARFDHLSVNDGLSQSTVSAITQDHKGFLWFGTRDGGLNRYDGYDFAVYKNDPDDPNSLSNNEVISILEDSRHILWVGTKHGELNRYDPAYGTFKHYALIEQTESDDSQKSIVYVIFENSRKELYVGHNTGIFRYNREDDSFSKILTDFRQPIEVVTGICEDDKGNMYFASYDRLVRYNPLTEETDFLEYRADTQWDKGNRPVPVIFDSRKNLWIGVADGLKMISSGHKMSFMDEMPVPGFNPKAFSNIRSILEASDKSLWYCSLHGLYHYDYSDNSLTEYKSESDNSESLGSNSVHSIYEDKLGTLWIGTYSGVDIIDSRKSNFGLIRHQTNNPGSLSHNHVTSFQEQQEGIWIGTKEAGLNYQSGKNTPFISYAIDPADPGAIRSNDIKTIFRDSSDNIWVGTFQGGLSLFDPNTGSFKHFMDGESVFDMVELPGNQLLLGTIKGLRVMDLTSRAIREFKSGSSLTELLNRIFIMQLFTDSRGKIWIGGRYDGLFRYDPEKGEIERFRFRKNDSTSLSSDYVMTFCEDADANIWIGTNNGLNMYAHREARIIRFPKNPDLADNVINGLLSDNDGNLWIATNGGLHRYEPLSQRLKHYDVRDGLQSNQFNRSACLKSSSGELFFGGIGGFNRFFPDQIRDNTVKPDIIITDFKLHGESVSPGEKNAPFNTHISDCKHITLSYKQNSFSLDFVAINYLNPENNQYSYKLEGFDKHWSEASTLRTASYMNLEPGNYIFRVRGSNNDGIWNEEGAEIDLVIKRPYWSSPLAFCVYILFLTGLVLLLINIVRFRTEKKNELEHERKEKETIRELNQMRLQFFTNIAHEFRTPLTLISAPLKKLISRKDEARQDYLLDLMQSNVNRMLRLVNQLMDFRKLENEKMQLHVRLGNLDIFISHIVHDFEVFANRKMIELRYEADSLLFEASEQWFDESIIDKVTYNLLSNAFKFAPEQGFIIVRLSLENQKAVLQIRDNGKGIAPEKTSRIFERFYSESPGDDTGTGIGLSLSKNLIDLHKGEISVESEEGKGSTFRISIPIGKEDFSKEEIVTDQTSYKYHRPQLDAVFNDPQLNTAEDPEEKDSQTILIVEDNKELSAFLQDHFSDFNTLIAENGKTGFDKAREVVPDIIITDIMMPVMGGLELCGKIKEDIITSHIPVLMLTARSAIEQKIEGLETGADAYLEKPFEPEYLTVLVNNLLSQRKLLREKYIEISPADTNTGPESLPGPDRRFLETVDQTIHELISDQDFSVEHLMKALHMSRTQIYRKFKQLLNQSPWEYIRIIRLKYARDMLKEKEHNVNEVAFMSGFGNVSYFITCFKKQFGISPGKYWDSIK